MLSCALIIRKRAAKSAFLKLKKPLALNQKDLYEEEAAWTRASPAVLSQMTCCQRNSSDLREGLTHCDCPCSFIYVAKLCQWLFPIMEIGAIFPPDLYLLMVMLWLSPNPSFELTAYMHSTKECELNLFHCLTHVLLTSDGLFSNVSSNGFLFVYFEM